MKRTTRALRGPLAALLAISALACNGFVGEWTILDGFGTKLANVERGQSREQVLTALGPPARETAEFTLPQREGFESLFDEAARSGATSFLYWNTGVDEVAVVGVDTAGRVAFKCRAGT